jgi:hypothetical protein
MGGVVDQGVLAERLSGAALCQARNGMITSDAAATAMPTVEPAGPSPVTSARTDSTVT